MQKMYMTTFHTVLALMRSIAMSAQVSVLVYPAMDGGSVEARAMLAEKIATSIGASVFNASNTAAAQAKDSVIAIAIPPDGLAWKKTVQLDIDSTGAVRSVSVHIPLGAVAYVSLVQASTGEVLRHRTHEYTELLSASDVEALGFIPAGEQSAAQGVKRNLTVRLSKEVLTREPALANSATFEEKKAWATDIIKGLMSAVEDTLFARLDQKLIPLIDELRGPWAVPIDATFATWPDRQRKGFTVSSRGFKFGDRKVVAVVDQVVDGLYAPLQLQEYSIPVVSADSIRLPGILMGIQPNALVVDKSALAASPVYVTSEPSHFYRSDAPPSAPRLRIVVDPWTPLYDGRILCEQLAASPVFDFHIPAIDSLLSVAAPSNDESTIRLTYADTRFGLSVEPEGMRKSYAFAKSTTSRIITEIVSNVANGVQIISAKEKKGKLKEGVLVSPLPLDNSSGSGYELTSLTGGADQPVAVVTTFATVPQNNIYEFRVFEGEDVLSRIFTESKMVKLQSRIK